MMYLPVIARAGSPQVDVIHNCDALTFLRAMPDNFVQCCVTSPPYYGLRDYGNDKQLGLEPTLKDYIDNLVEIFSELRRVLKDDGTFWLNLGDSFSSHKDCKSVPQSLAVGGSNEQAHVIDKGKSVTRDTRSLKAQGFKNKDLMMVPHRVAFALQDSGWWVRMDNVWHKPNPMPESVTDRPTKAHEYVFLLTKSAKYYYDADAIRVPHIWADSDKRAKLRRVAAKSGKSAQEDSQYAISGVGYHPNGKNRRSVWTVTTKPYKEAHFAVMPSDIPEICIKAGSKPGDIVLDMFMGAGTVGLVAKRLNRHYVGSEINPSYIEIANKRIDTDWEAHQLPLFAM